MGSDRQGKRQRGDGGDAGNSKRKYFQSHNKATIPLHSRGFLISCTSGKERQAAHEATALLEEYLDKLTAGLPKQEHSSTSKDFSRLIQDEVSDLKAKKGKLFEWHKTNINGLLYLSLTSEAEAVDPVDLVLRVARDVQTTKQCKSRLCIRFVPIETVCPANLGEIKKAAASLCERAFPAGAGAEPLKFAVQYEHRASVKLQRGDVIDAVVAGVPQPPHKVNLGQPDRTIIVQLIKGFCAMSVVSDFKELGRFNVRELSMTDEDKTAAKAASSKQQPDEAGALDTVAEANAAEHEQDDSTQAAVREGSPVSQGETPEVEAAQSPQQPKTKDVGADMR